MACRLTEHLLCRNRGRDTACSGNSPTSPYSEPKLSSPLPGLWTQAGSTGFPACADRNLGLYVWRGCIFSRGSNVPSFYPLSTQRGERGRVRGGNCAPISTVRWKDFPMSPLAKFITQNTHSFVPAWPLACETACNSAARRRRPAVSCGTAAGPLRHVKRYQAAQLRLQRGKNKTQSAIL